MAQEQQPAGDPEHVIAAFEQMPAVLWAFEGPRHRVIAANRAARASIGDRADIIGRPIREVIPEMAGQQIFEMIDHVYATGQPVSHADRRVLVDRDGDGNLEEDFYTYTFLPTRDADGAVTGMVVHIVETTRWVRQRQAAEARADDSERRYQQARDVVLALQRSLLPGGVPVLPRLRIAARYRVAGTRAAAGGDWFDAVTLPDDRVALLVGDVAGHGAEAAAVMGQLRAVGLQALASGSGVEEALSRLDALARTVRAAEGTTVCLVLLDPHTGQAQYVSRAHPAPLVLGADGTTRLLPTTPAAPLGSEGKPVRLHTDQLKAGEILLLYSDGLIERPGRPLDAGQAELARVAAAVLSEPVATATTLPALRVDRLCALLVERFSWAGYRDDVTVLAAELRSEPAAPPRLRLPARPASLSIARQAVGEWLAGLGVPAGLAGTVQHALGEAMANAVEHAYPSDRPGEFTVAADLDGQGLLRLVVADQGRWRPVPADPGGRGRGLMLMRGLVDRVQVAESASGTTVTLAHQLHREVQVDTSAATPPPAGAEPPPFTDVPFQIEHSDADPPVLRVRGAVDPATIDRLERAIQQLDRGGRRPLTVDLTEVTLLSSVGVRLLHRLDTDAARLRLIAPAGGAVSQVLALTGLSHLAMPVPSGAGPLHTFG